MGLRVFTQQHCAKCGSEHIRRNGHLAGHARYQCKACGHQARFVPAAVAKAAQYAQVDKLLTERSLQRRIARATGAARVTIVNRLKKAALPAPVLPRLRPKKAQRKEWEALELDELWTFVGHKKRNVRLWLVVERARRRIVGWTLGSRGEAPLRRLWQALPPLLPSLLVLHRPVEGPRQGAAPLAPRPLSQRRRTDQYRRSHQLFIAAAPWRTRPQILLVQQIFGHAHRPN